MAQSTIIMAFRKRAKSFGYTNISIKRSSGSIRVGKHIIRPVRKPCEERQNGV